MKEKIFNLKEKALNLLKQPKYMAGFLVIIILLVVSGIYLVKGNDSIKGFDVAFNLDMDYDTIKETFSDYEIKNENTDIDNLWIDYTDIVFLDNYNGSISFHFDEKKQIESCIFSFEDSDSDIEVTKVISDANEVFGEALHKENYNDKREERKTFLWDAKNDIYATFSFNVVDKSEEEYFYFEKIDMNKNEEIISRNEENEKNIQSNKKLKEAYDILLSRAQLIDKPITKAIDKYGASFSKKTYSNDIIFKEEITLLDKDVDLEYTINDPYDGDFSVEFDGQIQWIKFILNTDEKGSKEIIKTFKEMLGNYTEEETDYSIKYTWSDLPMNVSIDVYDENGEKRLLIDPSINDYYYKIDPSFNSTDSLKKYDQYDDVDLSILHAKTDDYVGSIKSYSSKGRKLKSLAESKVESYLKYPLTASFGSVSIYQAGNTYTVSGTVTAENGFGVPSTMNYKLYYTNNNGSYEFDFGEIDGKLI